MKLRVQKALHKMTAIVIVMATILASLHIGDITAYAYDAQGGMIYFTSGDIVETKDAPSPSGNKVSGLVYGKPVTVINEVQGTDGALWYQVTYYVSDGATQKTGYCPAVNVRLDKNSVITATGTANADNTLWSCTGTYKKPALATIPYGTKLYIVDTKDDGGTWYRVRCDIGGVQRFGWVESRYVTKDAVPDLPTDVDYEEQLRMLGFPESYIKPLALLHAQYPNWVFTPVFTNLDWNTVIYEESLKARSLIHKDSDDAKKSTAAGEYDWYTNTWTIRDSSGWVSAHPDYIAYCMDPRNFMTEPYIFMFESLSYSEAHNITGVSAILKGSFMTTDVLDTDGIMLNYAHAFMTIGQQIGVSPYHLASRVRQEQGVNGTSALISGTYPGFEGYFNYFNHGAYGTPTSVLIERGLTYAKNKGWDSRYKSLLGGSEIIGQKYIAVGQDTLYFQKFDVIEEGGLYNHQYMQNIEAAISESKGVSKAYEDKSQAFVFRIPIYNNMPESAVKFTTTGNRNNYLSSLNVSGVELTPTFDGANTEYTVIVDNSVESVNVSASPVVSVSKISGTGNYNLKVGENIITVTCTSQSGDPKTYKITVIKEEMGKADYTLTSDIYVLGDYITGVEPGTSAADFLNGFVCEGAQIKVINANGTDETGIVGTGDRLAVYVEGEVVELREIITYGDISGDGAITILDLVRLNRHTLNISALSGTQLLAADVNRNGSVNIQDLVMVNRHTLGIAAISQK